MDIITHTLSGVAAGTVVASFCYNSTLKKIGLIAFGGFGGMLPDIDAISLWRRFDSTIGKLFNLNNTGREIYSSKFWYSHHGFMHSLVAALLFACAVGLVFFMINNRVWQKKEHVKDRAFKFPLLMSISFALGFIIHLFEDMPTPASVWGGVDFLWPSAGYIGGLGKIWWWNNYDIFLIISCVVFVNLVLLSLNKLLKIKIKQITSGVFLIGMLLIIIQINTRDFDFNYRGHTLKYEQFELKSKEIQKQLLGETLYNWMESFDNKLGIYF